MKIQISFLDPDPTQWGMIDRTLKAHEGRPKGDITACAQFVNAGGDVARHAELSLAGLTGLLISMRMEQVGEALRTFVNAIGGPGPASEEQLPLSTDIYAEPDRAPAAEPTDNVIGTNTGHGHVWSRPDGMKARCGGPGLCSKCRTDEQLLKSSKGRQ